MFYSIIAGILSSAYVMTGIHRFGPPPTLFSQTFSPPLNSLQHDIGPWMEGEPSYQQSDDCVSFNENTFIDSVCLISVYYAICEIEQLS